MKPRVLFTTIFRPFSKPGKYNLPGDEKFLDYFSNRLTRESGPFVLHDNHPTMAPHLIAANIDADVTVLEAPTLEEFKDELRKNYDVLALTFLTLHFPKLVHMIAWARKLAPQTKIVIGGFGTALFDLERLDVDGVCQQEGISYMRQFLGQDPHEPVEHPLITYEIALRLGVQQLGLPKKRLGVIVNGFGCPHACEFCQTSAYFGKKHVPLIRTGSHLLETMARYEREADVRDFVIYEEDFFLYKRHIGDFIEAAGAHPTLFSYACYSTIKALSQFEIEDLVDSGLSHVWIGVESVNSPYSKSMGRPIRELFDELHRYGVTTTGSIIAGLDDHKRDNVWGEFEHLASLFPSTVQISNLMAGPGTPLRERLARENRLIQDHVLLDSHLYSDQVIHPEFGRGELRGLIFQGYDYIYDTIGPALYRIMKTWHQGSRTLRASSRARLRARGELLVQRAAAMRPIFLETFDYLPNDRIRAAVRECLAELEQDAGPPDAQSLAVARLFREAFDNERRRFEVEGPHVYEPPTRISHYAGGVRSRAGVRPSAPALAAMPGFIAAEQLTRRARGE
jgi:hypothetical protein